MFLSDLLGCLSDHQHPSPPPKHGYGSFGGKHVLIIIIGDDGQGGRVCYALWMCLLYATCPGIYAIIAAEVCQAFGPLHYQANFGLLYTQYVAYSVVIIVITKVGFDWLQCDTL